MLIWDATASQSLGPSPIEDPVAGQNFGTKICRVLVALDLFDGDLLGAHPLLQPEPTHLQVSA